MTVTGSGRKLSTQASADARLKPFLYFARADASCSSHDLAQMRFRLARELESVVSYMSQNDLEKANEPVVVLFTKLDVDLMKGCLSEPSTLPSIVSEQDMSRIKSLKKALEEIREVANPRFAILCNLLQPWNWIFVFLRSSQRLRQGLYKLYPMAAQVVLERKQVGKPSFYFVDDFTAPEDTLTRAQEKLKASLKPLLDMVTEQEPNSNEVIPVVIVCTDLQQLTQRFIQSPDANLEDLADLEYQRFLLSRDRIVEVEQVLSPRLIVLCNWANPQQWIFVLFRDFSRLFAPLSTMFPERQVFVWKGRWLWSPADASISDYCYSSRCSSRGRVQDVKLCPGCRTAKYCGVECQREHWTAVHCHYCAKVAGGHLSKDIAQRSTRSGTGTTQSGADTTSGLVPSSKGRALYSANSSMAASTVSNRLFARASASGAQQGLARKGSGDSKDSDDDLDF